jgi:hypothetical protein
VRFSTSTRALTSLHLFPLLTSLPGIFEVYKTENGPKPQSPYKCCRTGLESVPAGSVPLLANMSTRFSHQSAAMAAQNAQLTILCNKFFSHVT